MNWLIDLEMNFTRNDWRSRFWLDCKKKLQEQIWCFYKQIFVQYFCRGFQHQYFMDNFILQSSRVYQFILHVVKEYRI